MRRLALLAAALIALLGLTGCERHATWDRLAQCESHGDWGYGPHSSWGSRIYEGGLQFAPSTWDAYRYPWMPDAAYRASRLDQIAVAELVLADQGWRAWPACSRELGLR